LRVRHGPVASGFSRACWLASLRLAVSGAGSVFRTDHGPSNIPLGWAEIVRQNGSDRRGSSRVEAVLGPALREEVGSTTLERSWRRGRDLYARANGSTISTMARKGRCTLTIKHSAHARNRAFTNPGDHHLWLTVAPPGRSIRRCPPPRGLPAIYSSARSSPPSRACTARHLRPMFTSNPGSMSPTLVTTISWLGGRSGSWATMRECACSSSGIPIR